MSENLFAKAVFEALKNHHDEFQDVVGDFLKEEIEARVSDALDDMVESSVERAMEEFPDGASMSRALDSVEGFEGDLQSTQSMVEETQSEVEALKAEVEKLKSQASEMEKYLNFFRAFIKIPEDAPEETAKHA